MMPIQETSGNPLGLTHLPQRPWSGLLSWFCAFALAAVLLTWIVVASAAPEDGQTFKDWQMRCDKPTEPEKESCFMYQNLMLKEGSRQLLNVAVAYPPNQRIPVAILTIPLGISLPPGISVKVDDGEAIRLAVEYCVQQGCKTALRLNEKWLGLFKAGHQAQVTFHDGTRRAITVPVSLNGFTAAINALRTAVKK